jgi:Tol biopolymer transport system component
LRHAIRPTVAVSNIQGYIRPTRNARSNPHKEATVLSMRARLHPRWVVITLFLLVQACDSTSEPSSGALRLIIRTTGGDIDLDGYTAVVDGTAHQVAVNDTLVLTDVATGNHSAALEGIAGNCTVTGVNAQAARVRGGDTTDVSFQLACVATGVHVSVATTGVDLDGDGYSVLVDGSFAGNMGINSVVNVTRLAPGTHIVTLGAMASNCTAANNPRSVVVTAGVVSLVIFNTTCVAATGVIEVATATTGIDLDPDGYQVLLDSGSTLALPGNGIVRFTAVSPGPHRVTLSGAAANCAVGAENPRTVTVASGGATRDTARTTFNVSCVSRNGTLRITTATSGVDLDPDGYTVVVDETCDSYYYPYCYDLWNTGIGINAVVSNSTIPIGQHTVRLDGVASNCRVAGQNPRIVTVPSAAIADETFTVTCVQTASIQVAATTTGVDLDPDGYLIQIDGAIDHRGAGLPVNGNVTVAGLVPGDYTVRLIGTAPNCTVTSPNPTTVTLSGGATGSAAFTADCTAAATLAFAQNGDIYRMKTNGSGLSRLTTDSGYEDTPSWSPGGSQIAFRRDTAGNPEVYVMSANGLGPTRLTRQTGADYLPSWSSTGKIAFVSERTGDQEIFVMNPDGTGVTNLTNNSGLDTDPAWSPDGSKIAFQSTRDNASGSIYVMAADGSGSATRITNGGADGHPTWSPDGTKLAFHRTNCSGNVCEHDLFVVNAADGSGLTPLVSGSDDQADPAWSPDGAWIAFDVAPCDPYYGCTTYWRIAVVRSDGTDVRDIVGNARHAAWTP